MATYPNAGFNNPELGQAFGNIASLFAPPSPQEALVAQTLQQQRDAAAAKAAQVAQMTPYQQQLWTLGGGDPGLAAKVGQFQAATSGAPLAAQDAFNYANNGQAGNTFAGRQATSTLSSDQKQVIPAGVFGPNAITLTNPAPDKPDPTPTTDQVIAQAVMNYNKSPNDPAAKAALQTAMAARGSGGGTNVTIDNKAQTAEEAGYGGAVGGVLKGVVDNAAAAPGVLSNVATLRDAVNRAGPNLSTGPFAKQVLNAKQAWGSLTGTTLDGVPEAEVINNIGTNLASQATKDMTGRPSQFEFMQQLATKPGLAQSPQGMTALLNIKEQKARDDVALGQLAADPNNRKNWLATQQAYYDAHPIMSPFRPGQAFGQADIDAIPGVGADAANGGAAGPAVQPNAAAAAAPLAPRSPFGAPPSAMTAASGTGAPISPFNVNGPVASSAAAAGSANAAPATVPALAHAVSPAAAAHLQANPGTRADFDAYYGPGAAASILGQ